MEYVIDLLTVNKRVSNLVSMLLYCSFVDSLLNNVMNDKFCSRQSVYFNLNSFDSHFDILKKEKQLQVTLPFRI